MEVIIEVLQWYNIFVISTSFISLIFIKLLSYIFPIEIYNISKNLIRWLIIFSGFTKIIFFIYDAITSDELSFINRAAGPYAAVYWITIFFSCLLPFTLLFKKIGKKGWFILAVALVMNSGWMFERFVIIVTSLHRDYLPSSWSMSSPFVPLVTSIIYGAIQAVIITGLSIIYIKYTKIKKDV